MLGERLLFALGRKNWTEAELARRTGVTTSTINNYVCNKRGKYYEKLAVICKELDISADYLLGLRDDFKGGKE